MFSHTYRTNWSYGLDILSRDYDWTFLNEGFNLNRNTPTIKRSDQSLLLLIGIKVTVMMTSLKKHCYFRCSRPPDVDGIKIFDQDDQATKHYSFHLHVLQPGHLYQKLWPHQHQEALSTWNVYWQFLQWGHDKNIIPI